MYLRSRDLNRTHYARFYGTCEYRTCLASEIEVHKRSVDRRERKREKERKNEREREREREREGEKERKKFVLLFHASLQTLCTRAILSRSDSERIVFLFVQECYIKKFCLEKEKQTKGQIGQTNEACVCSNEVCYNWSCLLEEFL